MWYRQHRLEEVKSEVLRAVEAFEKLGAVWGIEDTRRLLREIKEATDNGELLEIIVLLPALFPHSKPGEVDDGIDGLCRVLQIHPSAGHQYPFPSSRPLLCLPDDTAISLPPFPLTARAFHPISASPPFTRIIPYRRYTARRR